MVLVAPGAGNGALRASASVLGVQVVELDQALAAFLEAAELGEALGTDRGRQIAAHARENAAQALKALGHPPIDAGSFRIDAMEITPVPVPHDAREPTQFVIAVDGLRLGLLTDLGSITPRVVEAFDGVDALLLECNHDPHMLANGPYPPSLQRRVGGSYGHLANAQAADFLRRIDHGRLRHLVAAHLSEKNNHPDLAREALAGVSTELDGCLSLLIQDAASDWFPLHP